MAHHPKERLFNYFGTVTWGDIADLTMYRRYDRRLVIFKKTWPDKPPSDKQLADRAAFSAAVAAWHLLTAEEQAQWDLAARRGCLTMSGYNLFLHWQLTPDLAAMRTLERQTRTTLLP